jgi:hypothetical protein
MSWKRPPKAGEPQTPAGSPAGERKVPPPMFVAKPKPLPAVRSDELGDLGFGDAEPQPMTIVQLTVDNVKRIKTARIEPDGNLVVLSGRNGQGKTSILDAIEYALGGKPDVSEPIRRGATDAKVVCDLGDLVVTRRFNAKGSTLEVGTRDGQRYATPQAILDELVGRLSFDPLAFARMKPKDQAEQLRAMVGIDLSKLDADRQQAYDSRTIANRDVKAMEARVKAAVRHEGVPAEEVAIDDLQAELDAANTHNDSVRECQRDLEDMQRQEIAARDRILALRKELADLEAKVAELSVSSSEAKTYLEQNAPIDTAEIRRKMASIGEINAKVRQNHATMELHVQLEKQAEISNRLTETIEAIDKAKADLIANTKMPVEGLGFGDGIVTMNGLPFNQASAAEQLRVSVAIACAMNPRLRVLLIRDASLLDHDSLRMVAEMAAQHGAQVWLERVETDEATTVVIEDGEIKLAAQ